MADEPEPEPSETALDHPRGISSGERDTAMAGGEDAASQLEEERDINERLISSMDRLGNIMSQRVRKLTVGIILSIIAAAAACVGAGFAWNAAKSNGAALKAVRLAQDVGAARGRRIEETANQTQRTLFLLDCVVVTAERFPNPDRDPMITDRATVYLNECFRINGVHPTTGIKLPVG